MITTSSGDRMSKSQMLEFSNSKFQHNRMEEKELSIPLEENRIKWYNDLGFKTGKLAMFVLGSKKLIQILKYFQIYL